MEWPTNTYLVAQINLAEAAALDVWEWFPSDGTAYLFVDTSRLDSSPYSSTAAHAIVTDNEAPRTLRAAPPDKELPDKGRLYKQDYLRWTYWVVMKPIFSLGFAEELPTEFVDGLEAELGISMGDPKESVIGGVPKTWQDEGAADLFLPRGGGFYDDAGEDPVGDRFLLFQDSFAEGTAHFWVQKDALASGAFEQIDMTFSGA